MTFKPTFVLFLCCIFLTFCSLGHSVPISCLNLKGNQKFCLAKVMFLERVLIQSCWLKPNAVRINNHLFNTKQINALLVTCKPQFDVNSNYCCSSI